LDRVKRTASILTYMADNKLPCRVSEMSKFLKIDKSSTSRILKSLEDLDWVKKLPSEEYVLGNKFLGLGLSFISEIDIRRISLPYLYDLNNISKETVSLVLRVGLLEDMCVDQVQSPNPIRHVISLGQKDPLWSGSPGKVILANLESEELDTIFSIWRKAGDLVLASGQTQDLDLLRSELPLIKTQGYAITHSERVQLITSISAPVFERNKAVGTVTITGPLPRFDEKIAKTFIVPLIQTTQNINTRTGSSI
jgi:IclR family transcriptional regulator, KDG regulon repressor